MAIILDLILGLVLAEALVLGLFHAATGRGLAPRDYLANLGAGFLLLAAARIALTDGPAWSLAACLLGALLSHLTDLAGRWRAT